MGKVAGKQGVALQQLFQYKSYFCKNSDCRKISFFNDGIFKLGYFEFFHLLFPFLALIKL